MTTCRKRDLWISPHHAMFPLLDPDVLIEAKDLVNGVSIVQAERVDKVDYVHIELDTHDAIIAEGALSETFIDDDSRGMFHNAQEYDTLYAGEVPARPACVIARLGAMKATRSSGAAPAGSCAPALWAPPTCPRASARCAVTSTASVRPALPAGRRISTRPKRRSASTSLQMAG